MTLATLHSSFANVHELDLMCSSLTLLAQSELGVLSPTPYNLNVGTPILMSSRASGQTTTYPLWFVYCGRDHEADSQSRSTTLGSARYASQTGATQSLSFSQGLEQDKSF